MGTNYYIIKNLCDCCQRYDRFAHIGKSSGGWQFTFRGYRAAWSDDFTEELNILSFTDWKNYLKRTKAHIKDEYGADISLKDFISLVEANKSEKYNHTLYCREHYDYSVQAKNWLDDEGNPFSGEWFQ
jgi:hypothetical protein